MKYYFAPMEGITGHVYRRVHHQFFPGMEKYFTPFLSPGQKKSMTPREIQDVLPENNPGYFLVPQILTNKSEDFQKAAEALLSYGYQEVNLNLGCPSQTVVSKKKGAGFLEFTRELDRFLKEIFHEAGDLEISIKTRIGKEDPEEFCELLAIYNQYPLKELIIHPRVQTDFYRNNPNLEVFAEALQKSKNPVCYNGDLFTEELCRAFSQAFPCVEKLMLGRGLLINPALVQQLQGKGVLEKEALLHFHNTLCEEYQKVLSGDKNVLFKMKELWFYMGNLFPEQKKYIKKIKKAQKLAEYQKTAEALISTFCQEVNVQGNTAIQL